MISNEKGNNSVEVAILLALLVLLAMGSVRFAGESSQQTFQTSADAMSQNFDATGGSEGGGEPVKNKAEPTTNPQPEVFAQPLEPALQPR